MKRIFFWSIFLLFSTSLFAQNPNKQRMTEAVYSEWNRIKNTTISPDGNWVAYGLEKERGDNILVVYHAPTAKETRFERADGHHLTYDNQHLIFTIHPHLDTLDNQRRRKVKKDDLPKDTLAIYTLQTGAITKIPNIKSYKVPEKWANFIAYQLEKAKEELQDSAMVKIDTATQAVSLKWNKKESDDNGNRLYIRQLNTAQEDTIYYVKDYQLAKEGERILIHSTGNDSTTQAGIYQFDCSKKELQFIFRGEGEYKKLIYDKTGNQASFIADLDTTKARIRPWGLYYFNEKMDSAKLILKKNFRFLAKDWLVSEHYDTRFSDDGSQLAFGINPKPILQDTSLLEEEIVQVEVWTYQDKRLYPQQKVRLDQDKKKAYPCVYHTKTGKMQQLGEETIEDISFTPKMQAKTVMGYTEKPYLETISWEGFPSYKDIFAIDSESGTKRKVATKVKANPLISPAGKYAYWYDYADSIWVACTTKEGRPVTISSSINTPIYDELNDRPMHPWPYGNMGWLEKDEALFIYDRYDIWKLDPMGKLPAERLTNGRANKTVYRYIKLDREATHISKKGKLLLHTFNENTAASGYAYLNLKNGELQAVFETDHAYTRWGVIKAEKADQLVYTRENFQEFPDLWYTNTSFDAPEKISQANPQQKKYSWGTIEHYTWTSATGETLKGLLAKPENFDPNKQYPLLVNFYERSSHRLNSHRAPFAHRSTINYTFYLNRGYVIFNPDVSYKVGYPGESAEDAVISGVNALIAEGFVDKARIGVQGHSWGGYQVAHLITKTNIFACAESGAPVVNMFSAYGGIRWRSGLSRMFQYEHTQSRIGGTIWEKPLRYLENSPIFFADKIETPVLILHNDKDGAVPWYQGIEFFVAMRRLNKPAWMLNYNDEPHWPVKLQNRLDFQTRMAQFFDHFLLDQTAPQWMQRGVPAIEKGIRQGLE